MAESKFKQVVNDKLTEAEILEYIERVKGFQDTRNTIYEHEFREYLILFQEEAATLSKRELERVRDNFSQRFDLFHPIKVVNLNNEVVLEIPAVFRSPDTLNKVDESLMQNYFNAVQMSDPLRRYDIQAAGDIMNGIVAVTDMSDIKKYVQEKVDIEKKYFLKQEAKSETESVENGDRIKISTKGMF